MRKVPEFLSHVPEENFIFDCHLLHGELVDTSTGTGWHSVLPMTRETFESLSLPDGVRKGGIATSVTDAYYFRRSPGSDSDGPLTQRKIDGHTFMHVANPPSTGPTSLSDDGGHPFQLLVDKHHTLIYDKDRQVRIIRSPEGEDFVELIAPAKDGGAILQGSDVPANIDDLDLPKGWELRIEVTRKLTQVHLPTPTRAIFFANGASFQGPVEAF